MSETYRKKHQNRQSADWLVDADGKPLGLIGPEGKVDQPVIAETSSPGGGNRIPQLVAGSDVLDPRALPLAGNTSLGTLMYSCDSLAGFSAAAGGHALELVDVDVPEIGKKGKSIKFEVDAGILKSLVMPAVPAIYAGNQTLVLVLENLTPNADVSATWTIGDAAFANRFIKSETLNRYGLQALSFGNSPTVNDWTVDAGSPSWSAIEQCRWRIQGPAAGPATTILHGIYATPYSPPVVDMIFDDGTADHYSMVLPMLNRYGLRAGFAVTRDWLNQPGFMTDAQCDALYDAGHDILVHGANVLPSFATLDLALHDITRNYTYVRDRWPRAADQYVYPGGNMYYAPTTDRTSIQSHMRSLGFAAGYYTTGGPTIRHRGLNALTLNRQPVNETLDMANVLSRVDQAASTGRGITLNLHQVLASGEGTTWLSITKAETLFAGLAARQAAGTIRVLPPSVSRRVLL